MSDAAIFASNDLMAPGAMDATRNYGLRIPDVVCIIGFDNIPQRQHTHPPLTTVRQPLQEMGQTAVRMVLEIIRQPDKPLERARLNTQLVIRASCQPPPKASKRGARLGLTRQGKALRS
ncbi:MAG: substrate-binding domain-containing protein [Anaerolineae bacterium]|nr:substrate-binding domain-containing protein [Anaerolineae bacterium]